MVPQVIQDLFDTYGAITPQSLTTTKTKLETITYEHAGLIVNIFAAINDYTNMAEEAASKATETIPQLESA